MIMTLSPNFFKRKGSYAPFPVKFMISPEQKNLRRGLLNVSSFQMQTQDRNRGEIRSNAPGIPSRFMQFSQGPRVIGTYAPTDGAILVNLTLGMRFGYRILYRITSLALRTGGIMEVCNEDMAIFAFPKGGTIEFIEELGLSLIVTRTVVSPREKAISKVNIRFLST
jgi:hypothetical protein